MGFNITSFYRFAFITSFVGLLAIISDFGFSQTEYTRNLLGRFYFFVLGVGLVSTFLRYFKNFNLFKRPVFFFDAASVLFTFWLFYLYLFVGDAFEVDELLSNPVWIKIGVLLTFIREFSDIRINLKRSVLNPGQIFILSFLGIIFVGSFLLVLPKSTHEGISYIDALFTSTSAVCVTGLIVVDTATHFTSFGKTIIMMLIQVGGLGILTFASYFSYFFKGGTTYENQLALSDMTSSKKLGEVFSTLKYIILITFGIEFVSAAFIYSSISPRAFDSHTEHVFFAAFHAISAFCNAGFSTLTEGLYDTGFRYNYFMQLVIIATFVLGGLGFPIVVNLLTYLKYKIKSLFRFNAKKSTYRPWVLNLNSRITLITTASISVVAFVAFYFLEYYNTLAEHSGFGKVVTALFGATTPRTAGFNTIDTTALTFPTLMMVFLLMWIGASPQSTGGGIKTSTFAIATLNILSLAKGKSRIEIFRREIADISVRRAFAIISLSLIVIGGAIVLLALFEPGKKLVDIAFECFSAYSTVGLSMGITGSLGMYSKMTLIVVMFVGRISMLTLVIAVFNKIKQKNYSYPKEEITIN